MPTHHHSHALKEAIIAHWQNGLTSSGKKTTLIFNETGVKIDQHAYCDMLASKVLPWIESQDWPHGYVFQQDGAPAHTSLLVQEWLHDNFERFRPKHFWSPSSPDLNVIDFAIWGMLARKACERPHKN